MFIYVYIYIYIILLLVLNPWTGFWQESEPSQATGVALVRCILGKFLGVVCHCFPPYIYIYSHTTELTTQMYFN